MGRWARQSGRVLFVIVAAVACGCGAGGGGGDAGIGFAGSVNEVVLDQTAASAERPPAGFFARLRAWILAAEAVAQSQDCPEGASEVLACAATLDPAQDCNESAITCRPMSSSTCRFDVSTVIRVECTEDGRRGFAFPFFVQDADGDGAPGEDEPRTASLPFACANEDPNGCSTCNGDEFFWHGVSVDFPRGEAGAAALEKRRDRCGPTPTPVPSATAGPAPTPTPILP